MDKTLVRRTFWFDPAMRQSNVNLTVYSQTAPVYGGNLFEKERYKQRDVEKQPETSQLKNCTAMMNDKLFPLSFSSSWFVVACDERLNATFICESPTGVQGSINKYIASNSSCDKDWFQLRENCFKMFASTSPVNYYQARGECGAHNSSMLDISAVSCSARAKTELFFYIGFAIQLVRDSYAAINLTHPILSLNDQELTVIMSGMVPVAKSKRHIFNLLHSLFLQKAIFVNVNKKCGVVKERWVSDDIMHSSRLLRDWRALYQECDEPTAFITVICEKPSTPVTKNCQNAFFECDDKTCILSVYMCDFFNDCVDGEDEASCLDVVWMKDDFSLINDTLYLPCVLYQHCEASMFTLVAPVKIHSICDGIKSHDLTLDESEMCTWEPSQTIDQLGFVVNYIEVEELWRKANTTILSLEELAMIDFDDEFRSQESYLTNINSFVPTYRDVSYNSTSLTRHLIKCEQTRNVVTTAQMCKIYPEDKQCASVARSEICKDIICPGMFKCKNYYCIAMSAVCDEQPDCLYGEDESFCMDFICHGTLKCRGESKCIGWDQVCNGNIDCTRSYDDEVGCTQCPENCKCDGFILYCNVDNDIQKQIISDELQIYKAIILRGSQRRLDLDTLFSIPTIYLNFSNCDIRNVSAGNDAHIYVQQILFSDLSSNYLNDVRFLSGAIFYNIILLDIRKNFITIFLDDDIRLPYLQVIYLINNPLQIITIKQNLALVKLFDLQGVRYKTSLINSLIIIEHDTLRIVVTDFSMCCVFPSNVKCDCKCNEQRCYGIINGVIAKIIYHILVILSSTLSILVIFKLIRQLVAKQKWKNCYSRIKLNHVVCDVMLTLCLIVLSCIDMKNVHLLQWRHGTICFALHVSISISLGLSSFFKTSSLVLVAFRIMYPFKHQCQWFRYTTVAAFMFWILMLGLFVMSTMRTQISQNTPTVDKFCSLCDCHTQNFGNIFPLLVCLIDSIIILIFIGVVGKTALVLREQVLSRPFANTLSPIRIVINLSKHLFPQLIFTVTLFLVFLTKSINYMYWREYCLVVVAFILTTNTFLGSMFNLLM